MHNDCGTMAYRQRNKPELFAMVHTLGPPTFYITLSANDMSWPDFLYILAKQAGWV